MKTNTTKPTPLRTPRPYGRQSQGKTIRSVSLDAGIARWAQKTAARENRGMSNFVNELLKKRRDRATAKTR